MGKCVLSRENRLIGSVRGGKESREACVGSRKRGEGWKRGNQEKWVVCEKEPFLRTYFQLATFPLCVPV